MDADRQMKFSSSYKLIIVVFTTGVTLILLVPAHHKLRPEQLT